MGATRSRSAEKAYGKQRKAEAGDACVFCAITPSSEQYVGATNSFKVIKNIYGYSYWDGQAVAEHLMITPNAHTDTLAYMTNAQKVEFLDLLTKYETSGYNVYARAPGSIRKTIHHQHTHLIKPKGKPFKLLFYLERPYFRFLR